MTFMDCIDEKYKIKKDGTILSFRFRKPLKPSITKCGESMELLVFNVLQGIFK